MEVKTKQGEVTGQHKKKNVGQEVRWHEALWRSGAEVGWGEGDLEVRGGGLSMRCGVVFCFAWYRVVCVCFGVAIWFCDGLVLGRAAFMCFFLRCGKGWCESEESADGAARKKV